MAFLLRAELPDVPGALGALASAIGAAGANIEAIEIVEHRHGGRAVDDVLLELPAGVLPDMVVSSCHRLAGVRVLWISRYTAAASLQLDLEVVEALTEQPQAALTRLVDCVPIAFRADWSALIAVAGDRVDVLAETSATPDLAAVAVVWSALARPGRLPTAEQPEPWKSMLVAGVPVGRDGPDGRLLLLGRRGGPEILDSELARLAHLTGLAVTISVP